jgi:hypothetical protein
MKRWMNAVPIAGLVVGLTSSSMAASDVKKAEHAVSGATHRVSQSYHKELKHYHRRKARHQARKGHYGEAMRQEEKAQWHSNAAHKQRHAARVKEKAVRHD